MSATITLQTGDYYIQAHDEPRRFIGVDTRSRLYPRALVALPDGHQPLVLPPLLVCFVYA